ncbi:hypothetical protein KG088_16720 [Halomonas sp. TRM85114]|uniref:pilus assembly protein TadG-related protein n=1 Tax=Halomonas jincaotanensis TaxID=2810616 RepID=UPI001BD23808|nr:pilus assembly protein TadG-related protein [Halomonas jincaotanensis]MBS9405261.1 hypothetical protein [Halomonas jincaotanensis]
MNMKLSLSNTRSRFGSPRRQGGVSMVLLAVSLFMLLGFTALAVDGGNLYVARNELQNAADAGALAGARFLYTNDGSAGNPAYYTYAKEAVEKNYSQNTPVEDLEITPGHWSFGLMPGSSPGFTPYNGGIWSAPILTGASTEELDNDPTFINAVKVVAARSDIKVQTFFGSTLGLDPYEASANAVAYIGFAGALRPEDTDQPIAMCKQALMDGEEYSCDVGRFIPEGDQTGGWTNFEHDDSGASSASELKDLICGEGNPDELRFGEDIATNNGQVQAAFKALYDCWEQETDKERLWSLTLPVVDCEDGIAPSNPLVGAVDLNIAWIVDQDNKIDDDAPQQMELPPEDSDGVSPGTWSNADADGVTRWDDFVASMNIRDSDGSLAEWSSDPQESGWRQKSIYFLPSCSYHEPKGQTGGENFGILARIPVLVD